MDKETVKQWLERVTSWKAHGMGGARHPNNADMQQLRTFLQELHDQLVQWGRPTVTMQNLPNVCQLLEQLCSNDVLKLQETDYQLVLKCVLALHTSQPNGLLEEKANEWAQSRIRHSASYYKENSSCCGVGEAIGCSASQYNDAASLKLLQSMVEDLNKVPFTRWDSNANCLVPSTQLSSTTLRDLSEMCLPLVTSGGAVAPLVECLLSSHGNGTMDALSPTFLQALVKTQDLAYLNQCSLELSYEGRVSLWTRHLPALESEFLKLVGALVPLLPASKLKAKQLILSRGLPTACVENPPLLTTVETLMKLLLQHTKGSPFILTLMELFNGCINETQSSLPLSYFCHGQRPGTDGLYHQLQADPQDLPTSLLALHINNISNCLNQIPASDSANRLQAWLLLVQSQGWYRAVMKMSLLGPTDSSAACLNVLAWYNVPLAPDRHLQYKEKLGDLVTSVRGLCVKCSVRAQDLHYAFSQLRGGQQDGYLRNVVRPLMMLFLVYGSGNHHMLQDIIVMATGENQQNSATKFTFLLDSIEFAFMRDEPHAFTASIQQGLGYQERNTARALYLCQVTYEEYQREQAAGTVRLSDEQHRGLLGRYDRIQKQLG